MLASFGEQKAKWKGKIELENGVKVVKNPKKPIYGEDVFSLEEELAIGEAEGMEEYMFSQIRDIAVDDKENIYVLDLKESHVKKFSKYGKYLNTIGKKGEGPGEIGMPAFISITKQSELIVEDPMNRRLAFFSLEGDFLRNFSYAKMSIVKVGFDKEGNIIGGTVNIEKQVYEIRKVSPEINFICSYGSAPLPLNPQVYNPFKPPLRWALLSDDTVICSNPEEYIIEVYNPGGEIIKKIVKEFQPVDITQEEIEEAKKAIPLGRKLEIQKHHSPYYWFAADDEGRLYVRTYERTSCDKEYYNDVFDKDGKYIMKIPLKALPRVIKKKKIYTIEEDEEGYQYVKRYKLSLKY